MSRIPSAQEIGKMAKAVLASQGTDAQLYITRQIGDLMASGDLLAVSVWREVRKALVTLQQEMGPQGRTPRPSQPDQA